MWGNKGMKTQRQSVRQGIALIMAMVFIVIFAAISIGFLSLSSANTQTANNHRIGNGAFCSAQSGYEIIRYLASGIQVHGIYGTDPTATMREVYTNLQNRITASGMTCIALSPYPYTGTGPISISNVSLSADGPKTFSIKLDKADPNATTVYVLITGNDGQVSRRIKVNYTLAEHGHSVFDYGIATKGPLDMSGQSTITGVNLAVESDVFIDTSIVGDSFSIGSKASVQGDVHIVNQYATYSINGSVGGETGPEAKDHVIIGVDPVNFPIPNVQHFRQFATGPVINSTNYSQHSVLENVVIAANTNPTFASDMVIKGILFVEQPNSVKFAGKAQIQGIIAADSEPGVFSTSNKLMFSGQVTCQDISTLQGEQFANLRNETGTFLIAPGFHADFTGQANVITGVIATAGVRFSGQAGGTINGSIINYASVPVTLQGQGNLQFNRSGTTINPAGFTPVKTLSINQSSYSEI